MYRSLVPCLALLAGGSSLSALDHVIVGPRALGMAGANVASTRDGTAQYYNPATFGFFGSKETELPGEDGQPTEVDPQYYDTDNQRLGDQQFGIQADATVGYRLTGRLSQLIDDIEDLEDDLDRIDEDNVTSNDVQTFIRVAELLGDLRDGGDELQVLANGGASIRIGHLAIGARVHGQAVGIIHDIDTNNLGLDFDDADDLSDELLEYNTNNNTISDFDTYNREYIGDETNQRLVDLGFDANAIKVMDAEIGKAIDDGTISAGLADVAVAEIENIATDLDGIGSGGDLDDNTTSLLVRGLTYAEIPVSYGYAINKHLSFGATAKYMIGRLYGTRIDVFQDELDEVAEDVEDNYQESSTFGIDLAVLGRIENFQAGLTIRNLNTPTFDGFQDQITGTQIPDLELEPDATLGVAWIPRSQLTLEAAVDLTSNKTVFGEYETQMAAVGAEIDLLHFLALRGGLMTNLAESDIGPLFTLGAGLNFWLMRIDLAGGMSFESSSYDGTDVPAESHLSLSLAAEF